MKYETELAAAVEAAEHELRDLDHSGLLLITEIGDYGLQIALSKMIDHLTVRAALRGAADRLEGKETPLLSEIIGGLKARGWKVDGAGGWHHVDSGAVYTRIEDVISAQTFLEIGRA